VKELINKAFLQWKQVMAVEQQTKQNVKIQKFLVGVIQIWMTENGKLLKVWGK
jgi:hypothetical protein